jgi:hypothetical protein
MTAPAGRMQQPWHVALAPIVPVLALLANNLSSTPPRVIVLPVVFGFAVTLTTWLILAVLSRNARTSALVATIVIVSLFSRTTIVNLASVVHVPALAPLVYTAVLGYCVRLMWRGGRVPEATTFANLLLAMLTAWLSGSVVWAETTRHAAHAPESPPIVARGAVERPDVYVLIVDGYGRADVLKDEYSLDNPLVPELERRGFTVAGTARSNYIQTALSISSLLNADYLQTILPPGNARSRSRRVLGDLIADNLLFRSLAQAGYRIRSYASEYPLISARRADERPGPWLPITEFGFSFYEGSGLAVMPRWLGGDGVLPEYLHRHQVMWTLDQLATEPHGDTATPTLVFAHLLMPHPPFVFNADGSVRTTSVPITLADGPDWRRNAAGTDERYHDGYADAVRFLNGQLTRIVDGILRRSQRPAIIYIQGDHGPGSHLHWESAAKSDLRERFGILMAMRLPDGKPASLPSHVTPVNAVRILLNEALGTQLPPLPDRSYFSGWALPFRFDEVTDRVP